MSQHDDDVRISHMLDYSREALELSKGRSREDLILTGLSNWHSFGLLRSLEKQPAGFPTKPGIVNRKYHGHRLSVYAIA